MSAESRRSGRIPKQVAILLIGSDIEGRIFSERTKTVVLSRHGAGIISEHKLSAEQEVVIRSEESNKEAEVRVVGQIGSAGEMYIYGVAFTRPDVNFWGIEFPPLSEAEKRASRTTLECGRCHARESADHSDLESDVYAINESIMRYCKRCGSSTLWKQPTGDQELPAAQFAATPRAGVWQPEARHEESAEQMGQSQNVDAATAAPAARVYTDRAGSSVDVADPAPATGSAASRGRQVHSKDSDNRRKHGRTRVNFKACIRRTDAPDDVVSCEDMSRGGIRFKSKKQYFEKAMIEVAVPYSPGSSAIFVAAQIAWVLELPEQKMWRCGAAYLRSGK
jgi:hypothetical protein